MATIKELRAVFTANAQGIKSGIQSLRNELKSFSNSAQNSISQTNNQFRNFSRVITVLQNQLAHAFDGGTDSINHLNQILDDAQQELNQTGSVGEDSLQSIQQAINEASDDFAHLGNSSTNSMEDIENAVNDVEHEINQLSSNGGIEEFADDINHAEHEFNDLGDTAVRETGRTEGAFDGLKGKLKGMIGIVAGVFAVDAIKDFAQKIIETSADIQALNSQYEQVMGKMKDTTDKYLDEMSKKWNKHPNELKNALMNYMAILKGKGLSEKDAYETAKKYMDMTVDGNAFANESMEDSTARVMGIIKGEYDSADTIMVNFSQTLLNEKAMEVYKKKWDNLTVTQQETLKTQEAIRQQTSAGVVGQGAREADSYANNLAMVKNTWDEILERYGSPLLEVANKGLKGMVTLLEGAGPAIEKAKNMLSPFSNAIKGVIAAFQGDNDKASSILEKLGLSSGQVQMLINAVNLIQKYIQFLWDYWKMAFQNIKTVVVALFNFLAPYIMPLIASVVEFVGQKIQQLKDFWSENGQQIIDATKNAFNLILTIIKFIMPAVLFVVNMVWSNIKGVIDGALKMIMGLIKIFAGLFTGDWSKMWEGIKQLLSGTIQFVWNLINLMMFGRIITAIKSFGIKAVTGFKNFFTQAKDVFKNLDTHIWNIIQTFVTKILSKFRGFYDEGARIFGMLRTFGETAFRALFTAIRTVVSNIYSAVVGRFSSMVSGSRNHLNGLLSAAKTIFGKVKNAIVNPIQTGKDLILGFIDKIKSAFSNMGVKIPLPHFSVSNFSLNPKDWIKNGIPKLAVDWYADGAIFTKPTLFNTPFGMKGFGEAGPEAALPLNESVLGMIGKAIAATMPQQNSDELINAILSLANRAVNLQIDGKTFAQATADYTGAEGGTRIRKVKRGLAT